jgi:hypothetical protein
VHDVLRRWLRECDGSQVPLPSHPDEQAA